MDTLKDLALILSSFMTMGLLVVCWYWLLSRFGTF